MKLNLLKINGKINKNKCEKSRGRSMVEMLGVLAIIGVLSIGGISGYTIAMRKYRANEILNVAGKYAFLVYSNCQKAIADDSSHYSSNGLAYRNNLWKCPIPIAFLDSGLGAMPSGAQEILVVDMFSWVDDNDRVYDYNLGADTYFYIQTKDNNDLVSLSIKFDSKELCKTAQSMVGKTYFLNKNTGSFEADQPDKMLCEENMLYFMNFVEN